MMTFPICGKSYKIPWFQTTNQWYNSRQPRTTTASCQWHSPLPVGSPGRLEWIVSTLHGPCVESVLHEDWTSRRSPICQFLGKFRCLEDLFCWCRSWILHGSLVMSPCFTSPNQLFMRCFPQTGKISGEPWQNDRSLGFCWQTNLRIIRQRWRRVFIIWDPTHPPTIIALHPFYIHFTSILHPFYIHFVVFLFSVFYCLIF